MTIKYKQVNKAGNHIDRKYIWPQLDMLRIDNSDLEAICT